MSNVRAFIASGSATQPQRFVIGEGESIDEAQATGRWLSSDAVVEVNV